MRALAKDAAKKAFYFAGVEISRVERRRLNLSSVLDHTSRLGFRPKTVIDVGVGNGTPELYGKFPGAMHLLVEPLEEYESVVAEIARRHPATYVIAAAGAEPGEATMNVYPTNMQGSSLYEEKNPNSVNGFSRRIPVVTLDGLCAERKLAQPYLIKADVQGAELEVLKGAGGILPDTDLILLEASLFQLYEGIPEFYEVVDFMKQRGFVVYDIVGGHNRPVDGALAQVDIAFVKENGMFRGEHAFTLPEQKEEFDKRQSKYFNPPKRG